MGWVPCADCCNKGCVDCTDCCKDALPASLDITFGAGWAEPTIDFEKGGCKGPYTDSCDDYFSSQTFNLIYQNSSITYDFCENSPIGSQLCWYGFQDELFCPAQYTPCYYTPLAYMTLYAWIECQLSGLCRIRVVLNLCILCGFYPWVYGGRSIFYWDTADFAIGGEICAGLSKPAPLTLSYHGYNADPEGICVIPPGATGILVEDGG